MHTPAAFTRQRLEPLGHRRDGRPFYLIAGASEGPPEGGQQGGDAGAAGTGTSGQGDPPAAGTGQPGAGTAPPDLEGLSEDEALAALLKLDTKALAHMVKGLRKENASRRAAPDPETVKAETEAATRAALLAQLRPGLKALGVELPDDDAEVDDGELQGKLTEAEQAQHVARLEVGVLRYAPKAGGNADLLLDSASFAQRIKQLDPAAADFSDKMQAEVKAHLAVHPHLKLAPAAGKAGAQINGGSGEKRTNGSVPLADAVAGVYGNG